MKKSTKMRRITHEELVRMNAGEHRRGIKRSKKMGDCKDNMKPKQTTKPKDGDKVFGVFKRKSRIKDPRTSAESLADMINNSDKRLNELIVTKQAELKTESGREDYNRKALGYLETMQFHLDQISDIAVEYSELQ